MDDFNNAPNPASCDAELISARTNKQVLHTLPLVEERVEVSKHEVVGDVVRVDLKTVPYAELVQTTLQSQGAEIERHAIGKTIKQAPEIRRDGNITIIPVVEERLVVRKELVLVEEIHITQTQSERDVRDTVTLRRQEPVVTRTPAEAPRK